MRYFFVFIITLFYLILSLIYPSHIKDTTYDVCLIFVKVIIPSIVPMYLLSSLLVNNKFFINLSYNVLKPFNLFESKDSYSILLSSVLVGNPTTTIVVLTKYKNNKITIKDSNILLSCSFFNPLFIITSYNLIGISQYIGYLYLFCSLISNILLLFCNPKSKLTNINSTSSYSLYDSINKLSSILLNIFILTIVISYVKIPFTSIKFLSIISSFLDVSTGIFSIAYSNINLTFKIILLTMLLSSSGLSIIMQSIFFIKQKAPDKIRYFSKIIVLSRIKFILLNTISFYILFKLFF